jgi:hypothetical protein
MHPPPKKTTALAGRATSLLAALVIAGCGANRDDTTTATANLSSTVLLGQGWSAADRDAFHRTTEGGVLFPVTWLRALEQAGSTSPLLDPRFLGHYGVLLDPGNPDGLPIGITKTPITGPDGGTFDAFAITCALCHTSEIAFRGQRIRIEGGGTMADPAGFVFGAIPAALIGTAGDPAKFDRFAHAVLPPGGDFDTKKAELAAAVKPVVDTFIAIATVTQQLHLNPIEEGYGRIDAMARVANNVFGPIAPQNFVPMAAPVSFPPLWDTQRFDWRHYTASIRQSMGRDVANAIAGGAQASPTSTHSTIDVAGLFDIEQRLDRLEPPSWPGDVLGAIDAAKVARGRTLFAAQCPECHARHEVTGGIILQPLFPLEEIGTDPTSAHELYDKTIDTGPWAFGQVNFFDAMAKVSERVKDQQYDAMHLTPVRRAAMDGYRTNDWRPLLFYKARQLDGVWATAPYLHNGSVASLYELLLPPSARKRAFFVGPDQQFDPIHVGYVADDPGTGAAFRLDTSLPGNANGGHDYGTTLSDDDRYALIEYLKTL